MDKSSPSIVIFGTGKYQNVNSDTFLCWIMQMFVDGKTQYVQTQYVCTICKMWFRISLATVPLTGTRLELSVISSTQFSSALVTGAPHILNNTVLSHSTHSK